MSNENFYTEWCVWDNDKRIVHREVISECEAQDWIAGFLHRRMILGDLATSSADRFTVRFRRTTLWSEEGTPFRA